MCNDVCGSGRDGEEMQDKNDDRVKDVGLWRLIHIENEGYNQVYIYSGIINTI